MQDILAIAAQGISKTFGEVQAVKNVDLAVKPGEVVAFLGPNGAGKTTTIDMMLGLLAPDTGKISLYGHHPRAAIARGLVSAVMQTGGLLKDITVRETVYLMSSFFDNITPPEECLQRAGITHIANQVVKKCSGGEQQRLRFALALIPNPGLIVLDEPTTGMDVEGRRDFWNAIHADAEEGRTVVFATHYLEEADAYADRIIMMRQGEIVADGSAAQIKSLVSGRTVSATVTMTSPIRERLTQLSGYESLELSGERLSLRTKNSDAALHYLVTATDAHDIEIVSHNLEEVFLTLTGDEAVNTENKKSLEETVK